jgi:hypothetical protein
MLPFIPYLHCLLYGRYGITPTMLLAEEVLHAYAIISSSIMLLFTSLFKRNKNINWKVHDKTRQKAEREVTSQRMSQSRGETILL